VQYEDTCGEEKEYEKENIRKRVKVRKKEPSSKIQMISVYAVREGAVNMQKPKESIIRVRYTRQLLFTALYSSANRKKSANLRDRTQRCAGAARRCERYGRGREPYGTACSIRGVHEAQNPAEQR